MSAELLTDRIDNKLEQSNLSKEHALNREPVPLIEKKRIEKTGAKATKELGSAERLSLARFAASHRSFRLWISHRLVQMGKKELFHAVLLSRHAKLLLRSVTRQKRHCGRLFTTATLHSVILMSRKAQVATKKIACDIDRRNRKVLFFCSIQQLSYLYIDNNTLTIKW